MNIFVILKNIKQSGVVKRRQFFSNQQLSEIFGPDTRMKAFIILLLLVAAKVSSAKIFDDSAKEKRVSLNHCFVDFLNVRDDLPFANEIKEIYLLDDEERKFCDNELQCIKQRIFKEDSDFCENFNNDLKENGNSKCVLESLEKLNVFQSLVKKMLFNPIIIHDPQYIQIDMENRSIAYVEAIEEIRRKMITTQMFCNPAKVFSKVFDDFFITREERMFFNSTEGAEDDRKEAEELQRDFCLLKNGRKNFVSKYFFYNFKENPEKIDFAMLNCRQDFIQDTMDLEVILLKQLLESMENLSRNQENCIRQTVTNNHDYARQLLKAEAIGKSRFNKQKRSKLRGKFVVFMTCFFRRIEKCLETKG
jgi:hypothetical protein